MDFSSVRNERVFYRQSPFGYYAVSARDKFFAEENRLFVEGLEINKPEQNPYYSKALLTYFIVDILPSAPIISRMLGTLADVSYEQDTNNTIGKTLSKKHFSKLKNKLNNSGIFPKFQRGISKLSRNSYIRLRMSIPSHYFGSKP